MKKVRIEKNTVQETLVIPLFGRAVCSERFPVAALAFDSCNRRGANMMRRTWLKEAGITDVNTFFHWRSRMRSEAGAGTSLPSLPRAICAAAGIFTAM